MNEVDVCVVGGGAAGLAAAIEAKENGAERVVVLDRNEELGGILPQCIHTGFGLHYFRENLTGPEYVTRFINKARQVEIGCKLETMVLDLKPTREILAVNQKDGLFKLRAKSLVLAMGCREKARGALRIPGTRPAGIFTAGAAQRFMDIEGYLPGRRVVILGSGDVGLIMARRLAMEGAEVEAVVEMLPYAGGLQRNVVQCLQDFNIPLMLNHTATLVQGTNRVEAVTVAEVDDTRKPLPNSERTIECDTLILSVGLIPENELSEAAGAVLDPSTGGPIVDEDMQTTVPGVFACGNVVQVQDLVDHVTALGELAGKSAAEYAQHRLTPLRKRVAMRAGLNVRNVVPQIISGEKTVRLQIRVGKPLKNVTVRVGGFSMPRRIVRPPEMVTYSMDGERLKELGVIEELVVKVEGEETP